MKTVRVISLVCDVSTGPPLHSYQILSKYVQGYRSHGAHKDASTDGRTDGRHADRYIPRTCRSGDKQYTARVVLFCLNVFMVILIKHLSLKITKVILSQS